jgi:hypothetical protein
MRKTAITTFRFCDKNITIAEIFEGKRYSSKNATANFATCTLAKLS